MFIYLCGKLIKNFKIMFKTQIIGNLGADAQIIDGEKPFIAFSIAEQGEENPTWVQCTLSFKKESGTPKILEYLKVGKKIYVEGKVHTKIFFNKETKAPCAALGLYVDKLELC